VLGFVRRHLVENFGRRRLPFAQVVRKGHVNAGIVFFRGDRDGKNFAQSESRKRLHRKNPSIGVNRHQLEGQHFWAREYLYQWSDVTNVWSGSASQKAFIPSFPCWRRMDIDPDLVLASTGCYRHRRRCTARRGAHSRQRSVGRREMGPGLSICLGLPLAPRPLRSIASARALLCGRTSLVST
jgi:hypothetical protein